MIIEEYSIFSESQMKCWDDFVISHPQGSPFHLSGWLKTIYETYAFEPNLYIFKDVSGKILGVFPLFLIRSLFFENRIISIPFSDYGGPLCFDEGLAPGSIQELLNKYKEKIISIEIRGHIPNGSGFVPLNYYKSHILDLKQGFSALMKKIDKRTIQYSIRKAERAGLELKEKNDEEGIEEFYRLNLLTRKKHGVPSQPKKFFENLLKYVIFKGHGYILLSYAGSKAVAGSLFLTCGGKIYYKYNASDPGVLGKITPNHALTWHAVKKGVEEGYHLMDFGRTSPDNKGLMRYKAMWGSETLDIIYYYYPKIKGGSSTQENSKFYRTFTRIWKQLPAPVIKIIGPWFYKYIV